MGSSSELPYLNFLIMAKKTQKEIILEKLELYSKQKDEVEILINKYIEIYQKLDGAISATKEILEGLEGKTERSNLVETPSV